MTNYLTRMITGEVRFSYVYLLSPRAFGSGGEEKFRVTILIPKSDSKTYRDVSYAVEQARYQGLREKWNGMAVDVSLPVYDGDGFRPDGTVYGDECKGHWVLVATSSAKYPPKICNADLTPICDPREVYSGMYGRIALRFAPYLVGEKCGIACYISTNVMKTRDGERLGGMTAVDDFGQFTVRDEGLPF